MAKHIVMCRVCKQKFDTNNGKEGVDWCNPTTNYYYHMDCYKNWRANTKDINGVADDDLWYDSLIDFLYQDKKMAVDFVKIKSQWDNYIKKGKTAKGIYFAARYYYEYQKGDINKSGGGIGIIPYVYEDSCRYWALREQKEKGILTKIEKQLVERKSQKTIVISTSKKEKKKGKTSVDWSIIDNMEEDVEC